MAEKAYKSRRNLDKRLRPPRVTMKDGKLVVNPLDMMFGYRKDKDTGEIKKYHYNSTGCYGMHSSVKRGTGPGMILKVGTKTVPGKSKARPRKGRGGTFAGLSKHANVQYEQDKFAINKKRFRTLFVKMEIRGLNEAEQTEMDRLEREELCPVMKVEDFAELIRLCKETARSVAANRVRVLLKDPKGQNATPH